MAFWGPSTPVNEANLNAQAIAYGDCTVGSNGMYASINEALAAGKVRIVLVPGATITANCALTAGGFIVTVGKACGLTGNFLLTISGDDALVNGVSFTNNTGVGLYVTGNRVLIHRCSFVSSLSHGLHLNGSMGNHRIYDSNWWANGGDGIRCEVNNAALIEGCNIAGNTGWGVNDLSNNSLFGPNWINGNVAGQINSTSTYRCHACRT